MPVMLILKNAFFDYWDRSKVDETHTRTHSCTTKARVPCKESIMSNSNWVCGNKALWVETMWNQCVHIIDMNLFSKSSGATHTTTKNELKINLNCWQLNDRLNLLSRTRIWHFKKIHLYACLINTNKIIKTVLQPSYNFVKYIFATNTDQTFIFNILQVKSESANVFIWKLSECIERQILYIWTIYIFPEWIIGIELVRRAKWMFDPCLQLLSI